MSLCPHCQSPVEASGGCPRCALDATAAASAPASLTSAAGIGGAGRFLPGTVIAGRYRMVGLLGRGGMGEVYRADDLVLGQSVALKFLPPDLARDPARLERFLGEVRTARQVTHANVCRVHDIGEVDGQRFLSMEYVDGEDLSSLLLRVGRLAPERAVEVARQICAGLAAAHDQGILHRDLKPANVMLDGRGRVRLTDFGLAGLADAVAADDVAVGTPAYMAPEQLAGHEVSVRSDIYALGLVLYELFTGRRAFAAESLAELKNLDRDAPSRPSTHVPGLDPTVEQALMRCLERDPAARPRSALAVAAALPGGDPLAAALAAGETPSPELVAEAGAREGWRPLRAWAVAAGGLALVLVAAWWAGTMSNTRYLALDRSPPVLLDRARTMLEDLGFSEPVYRDPVDQAWGYVVWGDVVQEVARADSSAARWEGLQDRPDAAGFWYRQSPRLLKPVAHDPPILQRGPVQLTNPSPESPGEVVIMLDLAGHLRRLDVMPRRFSGQEPTEIGWARLFGHAGLDTARFVEVRPRYQRFQAPDLRRAWVGTRAEAPDVELRVEAGAFEGRPVLFNVATSASLESLGDLPQADRPTVVQQINQSLPSVLILVVVALSIVLTSRHVSHVRADTRGAVRVAWAVFFLYLLANGLRSHSLFTRDWAGEVWPLLVGATFAAVAAWGMYSASEPFGRRWWPSMFVSLCRLVSRPRVQLRDPLIGQSVLAGVVTGGLDFLLRGPGYHWLSAAIASRPPDLMGTNLLLLRGQREALSLVLDQAMVLGTTFVLMVALVLVQGAVKRRRLAIALGLVLWVLIDGVGSLESAAMALVSSTILMVTLLRYGILGMMVNRVVVSVAFLARAADWSAWHAQGPLLAVLALALLAGYGAWSASARQVRRLDDF